MWSKWSLSFMFLACSFICISHLSLSCYMNHPCYLIVCCRLPHHLPHIWVLWSA
jgi:hypothetical protein